MCGCDYCANKSRYPVSGCDCFKCKTNMWTPDLIGATARSQGTYTLRDAVTQAVGAASACWHNLAGAGVFQEDKALWVVDGLLQVIHDKAEPNLGLATTAQLLNELRARAEIGGYANYRTVDN